MIDTQAESVPLPAAASEAEAADFQGAKSSDFEGAAEEFPSSLSLAISPVGIPGIPMLRGENKVESMSKVGSKKRKRSSKAKEISNFASKDVEKKTRRRRKEVVGQVGDRNKLQRPSHSSAANFFSFDWLADSLSKHSPGIIPCTAP